LKTLTTCQYVTKPSDRFGYLLFQWNKTREKRKSIHLDIEAISVTPISISEWQIAAPYQLYHIQSAC